MRLVIALVIALAYNAAAVVAAFGQAPTTVAPSPAATASPISPISSVSPAPATPMPSATAAVLPPESVPITPLPKFTLSASLVEDKNNDGRPDAGDAAPRQTLIELIPWGLQSASDRGIVAITPGTGSADVANANAVVISLLTAADGSFQFAHVPPGDYTLLVWWMGGFVHGGSPTVPYVYQAVFSIRSDGTIGRPSALPAVWPGVRGMVTNPANEVAEVGTLSSPILLKPSPPGLVPYPVSAGGAEPMAVGAIDVSVVLSKLRATVALPSTGTRSLGSDGGFPVAIVAALSALAALAALGLALPRLRRR